MNAPEIRNELIVNATSAESVLEAFLDISNLLKQQTYPIDKCYQFYVEWDNWTIVNVSGSCPVIAFAAHDALSYIMRKGMNQSSYVRIQLRDAGTRP